MRFKRSMQTAWGVVTLAGFAGLTGCVSLAPDYERPAAAIPDAWPQAAASTPADAASAPSAHNLGWRELVSSPRLREVIALALEHSRDLRVALLTMEQARAAYRIQDAPTVPTINGNAGMTATRTPAEASSAGVDVISRTYSVGLGVSAWELDVFGRVRSLSEAALQTFLNTEQAQRSTQLSLIADVATAWLTLAADQQLLALAQQTLQSQQTTYQLTQQRQALGAVSGLALVQIQTSVEAARLSVATAASQVQRDRHALELLTGRTLPDAWLPRPEDAEPAATVLVSVPEGLPSSVLQRRPDVLAAERLLQAANANIGAARAARFPRISLTATAGTASRDLGDLFQGGAWSFVPSVSLPIFDGGASAAAVRQAEITRDLRLASYDKAVQTAFREVADALSVRASLAERLAAQQALVTANQRAYEMAQARFQAGADTYLAVLDAQRSLFSAQQALITLRLTEQANRVTLYKVLGGG